MILIVCFTILFFLAWGLSCMLREKHQNQYFIEKSNNFNSMRSTKTSSGCGGTSYPDSELNHDFKRISRSTMFPYCNDGSRDILICKKCGYKTTGFAHDLAVNTLVKQVSSSEFETIRILEDKEYRERLRKKYKFK